MFTARCSLQMRKMIGVAILAACPMANALAYQEAGHFYTVAVLMDLATPKMSEADAHLIAFCAQLPDQSSDLDAVVVYKSVITHAPGAWFSWAKDNKVESDWVRRMITVQQLLHGLTGGTATKVQAVADATLKDLWNSVIMNPDAGSARDAKLCAIGFGFHLYGDSFAHTVMGDYGAPDPDIVYSTGVGHARDEHYPDLPLCAHLASAPRIFRHCDTGPKGRFDAWQRAWVKAAAYLSSSTASGAMPIERVKDVTASLLADESGASDYTLWNESKMQRTLSEVLWQDDAYGKFFSKHQSEEPCEVVLAAAFTSRLLASSAPFHCAEAWSIYEKAARAAFIANPAARENLGFKDPSDPYMVPILND